MLGKLSIWGEGGGVPTNLDNSRARGVGPTNLDDSRARAYLHLQ